MWSREELDRYARHILLPEVGADGQRRLKRSSVLVIGAGGLGAPALMYLAAVGVGRITIVDNDRVELSNLQRQVIFPPPDLGRPKATAAAERLSVMNPEIEVQAYDLELSSANALELLASHNLVVDASDNFPTRYLVNDAAVLLDKPLVHGAIHRFEGQLSVFHHLGGPCYRCLFPKPPRPESVRSCAEAGVLGVLPGVIGGLMAAEAVKLLLGIGRLLSGRMLVYDALDASFREFSFARREICPICSDSPTQVGLIDYQTFCRTSG